MERDDWLTTLEINHRLRAALDEPGHRELYLKALEKLEKLLDTPGQKRNFTANTLYGFRVGVRLTREERERSERLCARLWESSGTGKTYAEESLLGQVAVQAHPESLPFFQAALATNRERDKFQPTRRRLAVASVAFLAQQTGDAAAHAQLEAWLQHPDVAVRTEAVDAYGRIHLREEGGMDAPSLAWLQRIANEEKAFAPRFVARRRLQAAGAEVPVDAPEGVIAFRATLGDVSRTVELASTDSLDGLASTILDAFGWDHDHLYEFLLTGDERDRRFVLPDADQEAPGLAGLLAGLLESEEGERGEDTNGPEPRTSSPMDLPLGAFGFRKGHKLVFHFDFGDDHYFLLTVVDVKEKRERRARYPRVSEKEGRAPEQYARWD